MIDMTSWPELDVDVLDDVALDPANIRLEMPVNAPQPDIMRDIFVNGDAFSLVEGIVKVGYLTHETPIVLDRDGGTFVVEGNRRLAALKAIQNPYLIPEYQARITTLTKDFSGRDNLRVIRVKKAPDQDLANRVIAAIHTSNIRSPWKPPRQAAFFQAQVDAGKTLQVLLEEYPLSSVRRYVRASQLLNKFKNVPYRDPQLSDYIHSAKFPTSTLARIYESAEFNRILGIEMRPNGSIRTSTTDARFNRLATLIIQGMCDGDLTARTMPKTSSKTFTDLMNKIQQIVNEPGRGGASEQANNGKAEPRDGGHGNKGTGDQSNDDGATGSPGGGATGVSNSPAGSGQPGNGSGGEPQSGTGNGAPQADPTRKPNSVRLDPHGLSVPQSFPVAIHKIFAELIEIHVQKYPNAVMDLLRTFLEKVIKAYAREGDYKIVPRNGNHVQLSDCLVWLNAHVGNLPNYKGLSSVINRIQSRDSRLYPTSAAYLNDINHNPDMHATPGDAHELWEAMISLMRLMLK
ncbi:hypothetical protein GCM10009609_36200 [Pseudonocardia aurantiaca]|uniref:ParB/Sulfiredoxin domain-containing protein n=1 Tax=Pseudonocardia aurantiaca TaxID=75290 RepID=A0ABW4FTQ0_9PSEU